MKGIWLYFAGVGVTCFVVVIGIHLGWKPVWPPFFIVGCVCLLLAAIGFRSEI
jgi:hypothetical protein